VSTAYRIAKCLCGDRGCSKYTVAGFDGLHSLTDARLIANAQRCHDALSSDAVGRSFVELLMDAAGVLEAYGGGPLADGLRAKADEIREVLSEELQIVARA
jgi:hypothetical protein